MLFLGCAFLFSHHDDLPSTLALCLSPEFKLHMASTTGFAEASAIHALGLPELRAQTNFFFFLNNPSWVGLLSNKRNQAKHLTVLKVLHLLDVSRRRATFDSNTSQRFRQTTQEGGSIVLAQHSDSPFLKTQFSHLESGGRASEMAQSICHQD